MQWKTKSHFARYPRRNDANKQGPVNSASFWSRDTVMVRLVAGRCRSHTKATLKNATKRSSHVLQVYAFVSRCHFYMKRIVYTAAPPRPPRRSKELDVCEPRSDDYWSPGISQHVEMPVEETFRGRHRVILVNFRKYSILMTDSASFSQKGRFPRNPPFFRDRGNFHRLGMNTDNSQIRD